MNLIPDNAALLLAILAAISLGALFKGMTGLGLPLFAVPAMAMLTSVENAVILMIIPGIGANLWVVYSRRQHYSLIRRHYRFLIAGFIGGLAGTTLLHIVPNRGLKILLAIWLAVYLVQYFSGKKGQALFHGRGKLSYVIGLIAGTTQGATGISAQVIAPYYHGRSLQASQYAFIVAFTFMVFSAAQMTGAITNDLFTEERLRLSLIALVPTLIFTRVGISLADKISIDTFNKILLVVFFLMEIKLIMDVL
jgi:uncharacterized membrane protein YfcA